MKWTFLLNRRITGFRVVVELYEFADEKGGCRLSPAAPSSGCSSREFVSVNTVPTPLVSYDAQVEEIDHSIFVDISSRDPSQIGVGLVLSPIAHTLMKSQQLLPLQFIDMKSIIC